MQAWTRTARSPASTGSPAFSVKQVDASPVLKRTYNVSLRAGENGWIVVRCKELHVNTQGKTEQEAIKNAIAAINLVVNELGLEKEFNLNLQRNFSG